MRASLPTTPMPRSSPWPTLGLYRPAAEKDACLRASGRPHQGRRACTASSSRALKILGEPGPPGAVGADELMGDGARHPDPDPGRLYRAEMAAQGVDLPPGEYGHDLPPRRTCVPSGLRTERALRSGRSQVLLGWRDVPVDRGCPCRPRCAKEPVIRQIFIGRGADVIVPTRWSASSVIRDRQAAIQKLRSRTAARLRAQHELPHGHLGSLLLANQVGVSTTATWPTRARCRRWHGAPALSTNTFPSGRWHLFRMVAHNGEINTVKGNFNWMARP